MTASPLARLACKAWLTHTRPARGAQSFARAAECAGCGLASYRFARWASVPELTGARAIQQTPPMTSTVVQARIREGVHARSAAKASMALTSLIIAALSMPTASSRALLHHKGAVVTAEAFGTCANTCGARGFVDRICSRRAIPNAFAMSRAERGTVALHVLPRAWSTGREQPEEPRTLRAHGSISP